LIRQPVISTEGRDPRSVPNECAGSPEDPSRCSGQGFLASLEMTVGIYEGYFRDATLDTELFWFNAASMNDPRPIVVIGAGIIGLLTARELHRAGRQVTVLDRQAAGMESSWAGGGILSPLYPSRYPVSVLALARWSQDRYAALCDELAGANGIDPEYQRSGLIIRLRQENESKGHAVLTSMAAGWHSKIRAVRPDDLTQIEPRLNWGCDSALLMDDIAQVRNPRLLRALIADLTRMGVRLETGCQVLGFKITRNNLASVETTKGTVATDRCIVAAGAWSADLLRPTGLDLPIEPVLGQMLLFHCPSPVLSHIVMDGDFYLIPRRDGRVLAGSTVERSGFEKLTTAAARAFLFERATNMVPALGECEVEAHWAGLRPGSPDGVPFIGQHPGAEGLYICAGHYRNGLVLAPASARLAADIVLDRTPILNTQAFDPGRLAVEN
jgi:glycine oxidase